MESQTILHLCNIYCAERTFLLLSALSAFVEMSLSVLICKCSVTAVRTVELTHIENVPNLPAHLELLKVILA